MRLKNLRSLRKNSKLTHSVPNNSDIKLSMGIFLNKLKSSVGELMEKLNFKINLSKSVSEKIILPIIAGTIKNKERNLRSFFKNFTEIIKQRAWKTPQSIKFTDTPCHNAEDKKTTKRAIFIEYLFLTGR